MRRDDVAKLAGVPANQVAQVTAGEVRQAMADRVSEVVLEVATQETATYWRAGTSYYLDDPCFGDVVDIEQLDYNSEIGLHARREG